MVFDVKGLGLKGDLSTLGLGIWKFVYWLWVHHNVSASPKVQSITLIDIVLNVLNAMVLTH
jgi:hypothetical protein